MDIVATLQARLASLFPGAHSRGLQAVRLHIDAAIAHLDRGREGDATAFTDAIYRCNQAFEGSVKEAYRVLAGKDPGRTTPAKIEAFLTEQDLLRQRVLNQFTNYRTAWRNASTHDYTLDFDENEALLAIVSVTVFAIVLTEQMRSKLAAEAAEKAAPHASAPIANTVLLRDEVERHIVAFAHRHKLDVNAAASDYEGALAGYLTAQFATTPEIKVDVGLRINGREADIAVRRGDERLAIELKYMHKPLESRVLSGVEYLAELLSRGFTDGILLATVAGEQEVIATSAVTSRGQTVRAVLGTSLSKLLVDGKVD